MELRSLPSWRTTVAEQCGHLRRSALSVAECEQTVRAAYSDVSACTPFTDSDGDYHDNGHSHAVAALERAQSDLQSAETELLAAQAKGNQLLGEIHSVINLHSDAINDINGNVKGSYSALAGETSASLTEHRSELWALKDDLSKALSNSHSDAIESSSRDVGIRQDFEGAQTSSTLRDVFGGLVSVAGAVASATISVAAKLFGTLLGLATTLTSISRPLLARFRGNAPWETGQGSGAWRPIGGSTENTFSDWPQRRPAWSESWRSTGNSARTETNPHETVHSRPATSAPSGNSWSEIRRSAVGREAPSPRSQPDQWNAQKDRLEKIAFDEYCEQQSRKAQQSLDEYFESAIPSIGDNYWRGYEGGR